MPVGYWCPVLHAHLPYVRHPEHEDFLEEDWFFEALTETYVPLVIVLDGCWRTAWTTASR
jgi:1,4-alpha-glucan branching enzyme